MKNLNRRKLVLIGDKSHQSGKIIVGVIPFPKKLQEIETIGSISPGWISSMQQLFRNSVVRFLNVLKNAGFNSFEEACDNIDKSFSVIEKFLEDSSVETSKAVRSNFELLKEALVKAFKKNENLVNAAA